MKLIDRPVYVDKLLQYRDRNEIKILSGVRGVGKSSILNLFRQKLIDEGVNIEDIIRVDLESAECCFISHAVTLYGFISDKIIIQDKKYFLLIDEVQRVKGWQKTIAALKSNFQVDIYLSNSGANVIDDSLCDKLKHRPIEIHVLPLSFKEYHNFFKSDSLPIDKIFSDYLRFGSMPLLMETDRLEHLRDLFFSTMAQDIFAINKIADNSILILLTKILFTETGKVHSFNSINKILLEIMDKPPAVRTIENYIKMLVNSKLFYAVPVFDIKSNYTLTRYTKYYPVDLGFYSMVMGSHEIYDINILECVVYFELLRLGVKVSTCKIGNKKVAFIVESADNKMYIHITDTLRNLKNKSEAAKIFAPLRSINDHYSKWILTLDKGYDHSADGIRISNIIDFLMEE